jgi:outer membrane biosynthesis protein TonB
MLPGFRFLFTAIVLSMSILVFGLGAAALLRAAHEEVSSNPSWRAAPETMFAQGDTTRPVLAMLHVEPQAAEPKAPENIPAVAVAAEPATIAAAPAEPAASASTPAEPQRIAALRPDDAPQPETAKPAMPLAGTPAPSEAPPPQADVSAPADETKIASSEQASSDKVVPDKASPPSSEAAPAVSEQTSAPASPDPDAGATKIATLGGPAVITEAATPAKAASAKPDRSAIKKRLQARRAAQRRRIAARARLAQQPVQPAADPFAQPVPKLRTR